jgi:hypothetical protein
MIIFKTIEDAYEVYINPGHIIAVIHHIESNTWNVTATDHHIYQITEETAQYVRSQMMMYFNG